MLHVCRDGVLEGKIWTQVFGGEVCVVTRAGRPSTKPRCDRLPLEGVPADGRHGVGHDVLRDGTRELFRNRLHLLSRPTQRQRQDDKQKMHNNSKRARTDDNTRQDKYGLGFGLALRLRLLLPQPRPRPYITPQNKCSRLVVTEEYDDRNCLVLSCAARLTTSRPTPKPRSRPGAK